MMGLSKMEESDEDRQKGSMMGSKMKESDEVDLTMTDRQK